jgi:hypothetical protein
MSAPTHLVARNAVEQHAVWPPSSVQSKSLLKMAPLVWTHAMELILETTVRIGSQVNRADKPSRSWAVQDTIHDLRADRDHQAQFMR